MAVHPADILKPSTSKSATSDVLVLDGSSCLVPTPSGLLPASRLKQGSSVWNGMRWVRVLHCQHDRSTDGVYILTRLGYELRSFRSQWLVTSAGPSRFDAVQRGACIEFRQYPLAGNGDPDGAIAVAAAAVLATGIPPKRVYRAEPYLLGMLERVRQSWSSLQGMDDAYAVKLVRKLDVLQLKVKESALQKLEPLRTKLERSLLELIGTLSPEAIAMFLVHLIALCGERSNRYIQWKVRGGRNGHIVQQLMLAFGIPVERRQLQVNSKFRLAWHQSEHLLKLSKFDRQYHWVLSTWYRLAGRNTRPEYLADSIRDSVYMVLPCTVQPVYLEVEGGRLVCNGTVWLTAEEARS